MIKAILFDFDGVICDSEIFHVNISKEFFDQENIAVSYSEIYKSIGGNKKMNFLNDIYMTHKDEIPYDYETLKNKKKLHRNKYKNFNYATIMFKNVPDTLNELKSSGYKLALASSSDMSYIIKNIKDCQIDDMFDYVISGEMFKQSKPNPEIYNNCLEHFGINPDEAIIIEDSTYGIEAAKRAHVKVIAIKDYRFGLDQSQADYFVDDIKEIINIIKSLDK